MQTFVWQYISPLTFYCTFYFYHCFLFLSVPTGRYKEFCACNAFLTQNIVDVFRVLRTALRVQFCWWVIFAHSAETKKGECLNIRPYGWVSYLHRAATTDYLCCGQALEDLSGAGRIGLTHIFALTFTNSRATALLLCKDTHFFSYRNNYAKILYPNRAFKW